jgi:hypothetical protein
MQDNHSTHWAIFQTLAREHPACNSVKLTIELQRWFIEQQQNVFSRAMHTLMAQIDRKAANDDVSVPHRGIPLTPPLGPAEENSPPAH